MVCQLLSPQQPPPGGLARLRELIETKEQELTESVLLTFCMWPHTLVQNICRRVVPRQRLIYSKGRSTF
jgi:hypothetical protein